MFKNASGNVYIYIKVFFFKNAYIIIRREINL